MTKLLQQKKVTIETIIIFVNMVFGSFDLGSLQLVFLGKCYNFVDTNMGDFEIFKL